MTATPDWATVFREVGVGLGVFLLGVGVLMIGLGLSRLLRRIGTTLDEVDRQIAALGAPVAHTLDHVNGIANTADSTLARLGIAVAQVETVATGAAKGVNFVGDAFSPVLINFGATLTGITAGLRRLVRGTSPNGAVHAAAVSEPDTVQP